MFYVYFYILRNTKIEKMFNHNQLVYALHICKHNSSGSKFIIYTMFICVASQFTILPVSLQIHILRLITQPL